MFVSLPTVDDGHGLQVTRPMMTSLMAAAYLFPSTDGFLAALQDQGRWHRYKVVGVVKPILDLLNKAVGLQQLGIAEVPVCVQQLLPLADVPLCMPTHPPSQQDQSRLALADSTYHHRRAGKTSMQLLCQRLIRNISRVRQ